MPNQIANFNTLKLIAARWILRQTLLMQSQRTFRTDKKEVNNIFEKQKYLIRQCYIIDFIVQVSSHFLQFTLYWSCFISFPKSTLHCSCFISFPSVSPHFIDHVSFSFPSLHSPSHSYLCLPYLVALILHGHSTLWSVLLFSQSRLWKLTT